MSDILDDLVESGSAVKPPVLAILAECGPRTKRRKPVKPEARRGDSDAQGAACWRIPVPDNAWEELSRIHAADPASWDGQRFRSIYGVPKQIFDELVEEARQHPVLAGKQFYGDGVKGQFSKPLELKVAAVLEMCQAGLIFKTAERLYKISIPTLQKFFHDFTYHQVKYEYAKGRYASMLAETMSPPCDACHILVLRSIL